LQVVDGQQDRPVFGERPERGQRGGRDHALVERALRLSPSERNLEGTPLRLGHPPARIVERRLEKIGQRCERKRSLNVRGTRNENAVPTLARSLGALEPDGRLPDSCLALQYERTGATVEKRPHRLELTLASDNGLGLHVRSVTRRLTRLNPPADARRRAGASAAERRATLTPAERRREAPGGGRLSRRRWLGYGIASVSHRVTGAYECPPTRALAVVHHIWSPGASFTIV
jgi:hypothetical protein